jgi:LCP family protein required for cell wall assembly
MSRYAPSHTPRPLVRPIRRWPRRILLGVNLGVALCLITAGVIYGYARYRLDSIRTAAAPAETPTGKVTAAGLPPENILLIGNQSRAGLTNPQFGNPQLLSGSLSDVIMILHLDPAKDRASILSIPRDLFASMPKGNVSGPYEKIDAALNNGANGPNDLIAAIHQDFGIPINHYVEVNFTGFEKTVDALGGIRMDFPERLFDGYSLLDINHTGCQLVSGAQALALVRSRHLQYDPPGVNPNAPIINSGGLVKEGWPFDPESDLARIVRDHTFLRVLISTAEHEGLGNIVKLNNFLGAVINQITIDPGLKSQLIPLALHYRNLSAAAVPETTLPVTVVPSYTYGGAVLGDVDFPVQPADDKVIAAWDHGSLPTPVRPQRVEVYNAVGTTNLAADTGSALRRDGLPVTTEANAPIEASTSVTLVRYHPGQVAQGYDVLREFSGAVELQSDPSVPAGTVAVDVGSTEAVAGSVSTAASASSASTTPKATPSTAPTPGGQPASSAQDHLTPYDPRPCSS